MRRRRIAAILALAAVLALAVVACGGDDDEAAGGETGATDTGAQAQPGGTYRVDVETSFDFTADFDPTAEYTAVGWSFYNLMIRKLMTYKLTAGTDGNQPVPDLAAAEPEVSDDGLTYTFTLKDGIMFGPPLSREITSKDFKFEFDRLANPDIGAFGYPLYYEVIEGFKEVADGKAKSVSGIETPDDKTIVFHLTKPAGDFVYRLAMAAAGPVPEEVAGCFDQAGDYGRYVISSGPYMIEGSDKLDVSSCKAMKPISGFDPETQLVFVRNPDYDQATDDVRKNLPDRFEFKINSNSQDCFDKTIANQIEDNICSETGKIIKEYSTNPDLEGLLKAYPDDGVFYLSMNLALPPFDDIAVRKAVNLVMNKDAMIKAWGGSTVGEPGLHIIPPTMSPPNLEGYDPYATPNSAGDVEAAKEAMKQSKYDTNQDGLCDAPECKDVINIMGNTERDRSLVPIIEDGLTAIGITAKSRLLANPYEFIFTPKEKTQFSGTAGWGKDYPDAFTYFLYLFDGRTITPDFTYNEPLVGLTADQAKEIGIDYPEGGVPSVDADIDACIAIEDATERTNCWGDLDKKVMEEIVPWVPWIWRNNTNTISSAVTAWDFDQSTGMQAWPQVAVDQSKQN
ncbi:MAG TPA: ABC transporter substrate-binding protein [Gaiellaceae bacterium]|nr:ABC transporter substrate-binding protein [Gaiellaceae bacterium]